MIKLYQISDFENWYQTFQRDTKTNISEQQINNILNWINNKDNSILLEDQFELMSWSSASECYAVNNDIVLKTSKLVHIFYLYQKYLQNPILNSYVIPTYVYALPQAKPFITQHIDFLKKRHSEIKNQNYYSDCLILQQKCQNLTTAEFKLWENHIKSYPEFLHLDAYNFGNVGYLNGEIKLFDW